MKPEDYWWYCDLRRYGSCRHAGYGLGFERMVMYLTGISNIRDVELHLVVLRPAALRLLQARRIRPWL